MWEIPRRNQRGRPDVFLANVVKATVFFLIDVAKLIIFRPVVYSCPMCKSEFPQIPMGELNDFNFDNYPVTMPSKEVFTFKEATLEYLRHYFPNVDTNSYKIPSAFDFDQDERLDFATTDEEIEEALKRVKITTQRNPKKWKGPRTLSKTKEDRKQKLAVEKVAQAIYSLGKKFLGPMFVVSEFKFENFFKNVTIPKTERQLVTVFKGDHDIVVISRQKGIVFVQVKSVEREDRQPAWKTMKCAYEQVLKDVLAMKAMNRDLHFINELPMYSFVAVPNLLAEQLDFINICKIHRSLVLTATDLSEGNFNVWLSKHFLSKKNEISLPTLLNTIVKAAGRILKLTMNQEQNPANYVKYVLSIDDYELLCSRYAGLASMVKFRTPSQAINRLGGRVSRIMLNPEQNRCLAQNRNFNILLGDYGTGKSVVLTKQAGKVADKHDGLVYVISFSVVSDGSGKVQDEEDNLVPYLEGMIKHAQKGSTKIKVMRFLDYLKHVGRCNSLDFPHQGLHFPFQLTPNILCELMETTHTKDGIAHFFFDEVPLCLGLCEGGWERFETYCRSQKHVFVWISFATGSFTLTNEDNFVSLHRYLPRTFPKTIFKRCMRTTVNNFKLLKALRKFKGNGLYNADLSFQGNVIHGTRPLWLEMSACLCEDFKNPYQCSCVERRLKTVMEYAFKKVENVDHRHITILLHDTSLVMIRFLAKVVKNVCDVLVGEGNYAFKVSSLGDKRSQNNSSQQSGMTVVDLWSYKGNESKVVIFVDPYGGPVVWNIKSLWHGWPDLCVSISRSVAHFFFVTWPPKEQRYFLLDFATYLAQNAEKTKDEMMKDFYGGVAQAIRDGRRGHFWENKNFMDYLVYERVLEKCSF
ncbi:hypothetical protein HOLleu_38112 [Holothuria leucospilota]|uniref:Uncharacterized protein n=1 Tax=Holothuria leucospilota TaxID=206669 RepID=A0A9Q0YPV0_HOLLE|nr:hypothetical protein HOLleu_38112 [Holothuria leucospilota]